MQRYARLASLVLVTIALAGGFVSVAAEQAQGKQEPSVATSATI
jgi:hypothetical protein